MMTDRPVEDELRQLIGMAGDSAETPLNLRFAWSALSALRRHADLPVEMRSELDAINSDLERYIGTTELAKFGHGRPPADADLDAFVDRVLALDRFIATCQTRRDDPAMAGEGQDGADAG